MTGTGTGPPVGSNAETITGSRHLLPQSASADPPTRVVLPSDFRGGPGAIVVVSRPSRPRWPAGSRAIANERLLRSSTRRGER